MADHLTRAELQAGLPHILDSPQDDGVLEAIVIRPEPGLRKELESCKISLAGGTHGDHWVEGCWMSTEDGKPHPDVQICIMNARCIAHVSGARARWALAGDNLFIDLDISPENLPPGQRLRIGTAVIEITAVKHAACASFAGHYGQSAAVFVNARKGSALRLRGVYARVVQDGRVTAGDRVVKVG
ncbi:MAG: MOSC domain-containing protein [Limibaculum sp.]